MNWNDVNYFVTLVNEGTLTAAAEKLSVQHTTVARRIGVLEKALDLVLFDHRGKRYNLTAEGKRLYQQACEVEANIFTLKRMAFNQTVMAGRVVISAPPLLAYQMVLPNVMQFRKNNPNICLEIKGEVRKSNLYQREADIALRLSRPTEPTLVIRKLMELTYRFYAHKDYLPNKKPEWVDFQANATLSDWFHKVQSFTQFETSFATNDLHVTRRAVEQKLGIGILPDFCAYEDLVLANPLINSFLEPNKIQLQQSLPLYLVMHEEVRHSPRVRAVADWLITLFDSGCSNYC